MLSLAWTESVVIRTRAGLLRPATNSVHLMVVGVIIASTADLR